MPEIENLSEIMIKLEYLSEEYKNNIRSRRVYDLNALKKPVMISEDKKIRNNSPKQPISNLILTKLESPILQSKSLKTFRIR